MLYRGTPPYFLSQYLKIRIRAAHQPDPILPKMPGSVTLVLHSRGIPPRGGIYLMLPDPEIGRENKIPQTFPVKSSTAETTDFHAPFFCRFLVNSFADFLH